MLPCWVLTKDVAMCRAERQEGVQGLPRSSLKGTHPGVPPNGASVAIIFQRGWRSLAGGWGLPLLVFHPACIYLGSWGNTESYCCRLAGGLLGGPGSLSLSCWTRAGKPAREKGKQIPKLSPYCSFPPDQFSDLVHHQPANCLYGRKVGLWSRTSPWGWPGRRGTAQKAAPLSSPKEIGVKYRFQLNFSSHTGLADTQFNSARFYIDYIESP